MQLQVTAIRKTSSVWLLQRGWQAAQTPASKMSN